MYNIHPTGTLTTLPARLADEQDSSSITSLTAVANHIAHESCIAIAASGISMNSDLPNWKDVIQGLMQKLEKGKMLVKGTTAIVESFMKEKNYIDAAEMLQRGLTKSEHGDPGQGEDRRIYDNMQHMFRHNASGTSAQPNDYHRILTRLAFAHLLTTNYDTLLEQASGAWAEAPYYYNRLIWDERKFATKLAEHEQNEKLIIKLHGCTSNPPSIILTRSAYLRLYRDGHPVTRWMHDVFARTSLLFVGTGFTDYDILSVLRESSARSPRKVSHYAIVTDSLQDHQRSHLEACYNLRTIRVDKSDIPAVLTCLHGMVASKLAQESSVQVSRRPHFGDMVRPVLKRLRLALGADHMSLHLVRSMDSRMLHQWLPEPRNQQRHNLNDRPWVQESNGAPASVCDFFLRMRDINYCYTGDLCKDTDLEAEEVELASLLKTTFPLHKDMQSLMVIPIATHGKKLGLLAVSSAIKSAYSHYHLDALRSLSREVAELYMSHLARLRASSYSSDSNAFDFDMLDKTVKHSPIISYSSDKTNLGFLFYTVDYLRGKVTILCGADHLRRAIEDGRLPISNGRIELPIDGDYLALKAMDQGSALRYVDRASLENDNQTDACLANTRIGYDVFGISGNVFIAPVRSFGHVSSIIAAWNSPERNQDRFHATVFERIKRVVRVIINDYTQIQERSGGNLPNAYAFLEHMRTSLRSVAPSNERWGELLKRQEKRSALAAAVLSSLVTHPSSRLMKVRLWIRPPKIGEDFSDPTFSGAFELRYSHANSLALFANPATGLARAAENGYVDPSRYLTSHIDDPYTQFTIKRFALDPFARLQYPNDFGGRQDINSGALDKDPKGRWITAPVVWLRESYSLEDYRTGRCTRLLGFLSADTHRVDQGVAVEVKNTAEVEDYQRCILDLASHILAPILHAEISCPELQ